MRVKKVLLSSILELEGHNGWIWKDQFKKYTLCYLPYIDSTMDLNFSKILANLNMFCDKAQSTTTMILCDICSMDWHMQSLAPFVYQISIGNGFTFSGSGDIGVDNILTTATLINTTTLLCWFDIG